MLCTIEPSEARPSCIGEASPIPIWLLSTRAKAVRRLGLSAGSHQNLERLNTMHLALCSLKWVSGPRQGDRASTSQ